jgi:hypothetical protein
VRRQITRTDFNHEKQKEKRVFRLIGVHPKRLLTVSNSKLGLNLKRFVLNQERAWRERELLESVLYSASNIPRRRTVLTNGQGTITVKKRQKIARKMNTY